MTDFSHTRVLLLEAAALVYTDSSTGKRDASMEKTILVSELSIPISYFLLPKIASNLDPSGSESRS
jgi:hypothetical protein